MATFLSLPPEFHLMIMEQAAASGPKNLLNLVRSSDELAALYGNYSRQLLKTACSSALPSHPQFVRDAIQARFSLKSMDLSQAVEKGDELEAWVVMTPENDIWRPQYIENRLQALHYLVWNMNQIDAGAQELLAYTFRDDSLYYDVITMLEPRFRERWAEMKAFIVETLWLQESMRLRTYHRAPSNVAQMMQEILFLDDDDEEEEECGRAKLDQAITARQQVLQLYYRYLARVDEKYSAMRSMVRKIQTLFLEVVRDGVEKKWQWRLQELMVRWQWKETIRVSWLDETETDSDMVEQMPDVAMADVEFEDFKKHMGW